MPTGDKLRRQLGDIYASSEDYFINLHMCNEDNLIIFPAFSGISRWHSVTDPHP